VISTPAESYYFKQHVVSFDPAGVVWMKVAIKSCKHMMSLALIVVTTP